MIHTSSYPDPLLANPKCPKWTGPLNLSDPLKVLPKYNLAFQYFIIPILIKNVETNGVKK